MKYQRLRSLFALLAIVAMAAGVARGQGLQLTPDPEGRTAVLMTVSGGASMGTYQGGLTWALVAHLRRAPQLQLSGVGGASAGNINSLITVLEYCQARQTRPRESMFWKIWVGTGLDDLLPPFDAQHRAARSEEVAAQLRALGVHDAGAWDDPTDGIFSREFFHARQLEVLHATLQQKDWTACAGREIPVGVTVTSLTPRQVALDPEDRLWAATVRVASAFSMRFDEAVSFRQLPRAMRAANGIGVLLALPSDTAGRISTIDVFKVLEASSAFPLAFAPRALRFYDPQTLAGNGACPQNVRGTCNVPEREVFIDGGVFDNNPVDLIWALTHPRPTASLPDTRLIYIDPDTYRPPLEGTRFARGAPASTGGIDALLQLAQSAVPAARQYEMQSLQRVIQRYDSAIGSSLRITTRALPIYGDHLGAFAAFLGRPLREHDFYVGAYDGLRFIASEFVCRSVGGVEQQRCIADRLRAEIEGRHGFPLDSTAQLLWRAMFEAEFGTRTRPPGLNDTGTPGDSVLLDLLGQNLSLLERRAEQGCTHLAPLHAAMCSTGFERALRSLSERTRAQVDGWAAAPACSPDAGFLDAACQAEPSFARLLDNPARYAERLTEDILERIRIVEEERRRAGQPNHEWQVRFTQMVYRSAADRAKRMSFELDPSSIPDRDQRPSAALLHYVMPHYFISALVDDGDEFGWRPRFHLDRGWALDGLLGAVLWPGWKPQMTLGVGPSYKAAPWATLNASLVRTSPMRFWQESGSQWGMDASVRILTEKLAFSVRWFPRNDSELFAGDDVGFFVGLSDLNGMVYLLTNGLR
jgi:hypothetical protein